MGWWKFLPPHITCNFSRTVPSEVHAFCMIFMLCVVLLIIWAITGSRAAGHYTSSGAVVLWPTAGLGRVGPEGQHTGISSAHCHTLSLPPWQIVDDACLVTEIVITKSCVWVTLNDGHAWFYKMSTVLSHFSNWASVLQITKISGCPSRIWGHGPPLCIAHAWIYILNLKEEVLYKSFSTTLVLSRRKCSNQCSYRM